MARPNRTVLVHENMFNIQIKMVKNAINCISKKDSLNKEDIQAIKVLIDLCEMIFKVLEEKN